MYQLKIVLDDGAAVLISQLGNDFEFFQEKMEELLGGMYEILVNDVLKTAFGEFHSGTLLKLAFKMKGGKAVKLKEIQKMDKELATAVENFVIEDERLKEKLEIVRRAADESNTFFGIARDETVKDGFIKWVMFSMPEKNLVMFSILPRWKENQEEFHESYFYKIIMEQGNAADKVEDKIKEIDQALVVLHFAKDPCYKDKRELKHSPYQYAIRKLPYLRILRKSYAGRVAAKDVKEWQKQFEQITSSNQ